MNVDYALLTDLYQITMAQGYWDAEKAGEEACFTMYFRDYPFKGGYAVACGMAQLADLVETFRFSEEDIAYLTSLDAPAGGPLFDPAFLEYLRDLRLSVDIDAVPEGTIVFPHEPLVRVTGPIMQCQLIETALLNMVNFQTLIATKAARVCRAAKGRPVAEFGLRRAQGLGGVWASRAAVVGGCASTSNVLAGKLFNIPVSGTHAHSWVMSFDDELTAFREYARIFPNNCILLVDTYDVEQGIRNAITVGLEMRERGERLADAGFSRASDVASADIVVTFATSGSALEDLYFGDEGLVTTAAPGSTLVDLSAATPNFAREINAVATVNDLVMVEAPATVRSLVAADAFARENLLGPVATEAELTDEVRRLLDAIFGEVVEVGAPGRAQLLRNTHTLPLAADLVSAIEAVALDDASARSVGALDADQIPLFSPVSADPVVQAVRQQRYTGDYTAEMLLAELSAALMAADDAEVILPGVEATMHLLELLVVIGGADMAPAALSLVYQDEAAGARAGLDWTRAEQAYGHPASEEDEDWSAYDDEDGCGHDHFREDHDYDDYDDFAPYNDDFDYSSN